MQKLSNAIKCIECQQFLQQPVLVPCGHSVCREHTNNGGGDGTAARYTCPLCRIEYAASTSDGGFPPNRALETMSAEIRELDFGDDYKRAVTMCESLGEHIESLKLMCDDPTHVLHDRIAKYRNRVDVKRETLKLAVDDYADELMAQIDAYERDCMEHVSTAANGVAGEYKAIVTPAKQVLDMARVGLDESMSALNSLKIDVREYERSQAKSGELIASVKSEIDELTRWLIPYQQTGSVEERVAEFEQVDISTLEKKYDTWKLNASEIGLKDYENMLKWQSESFELPLPYESSYEPYDSIERLSSARTDKNPFRRRGFGGEASRADQTAAARHGPFGSLNRFDRFKGF